VTLGYLASIGYLLLNSTVVMTTGCSMTARDHPRILSSVGSVMRACLSFDLSLFRLSSAQEPDCLAAAASLAPQLGVALVGGLLLFAADRLSSGSAKTLVAPVVLFAASAALQAGRIPCSSTSVRQSMPPGRWSVCDAPPALQGARVALNDPLDAWTLRIEEGHTAFSLYGSLRLRQVPIILLVWISAPVEGERFALGGRWRGARRAQKRRLPPLSRSRPPRSRRCSCTRVTSSSSQTRACGTTASCARREQCR
jgi:hypothetical protein